MLSRRDALSPPERAAASAEIAVRAEAAIAESGKPGRVVALYAAKGTEVATAALDTALRARGLIICYPRTAGDGERQLTFHAVSASELAVSQFGIREPAAKTPAIELAAIDTFVLPGVAFDRAGARLGWGHGYYDVTLAAVPQARRVGLAFECQIVDAIEREAHDVLMNVVVTEVATREVA